MSTKLIRLSIAAFAKAEERGVSVPSEMYEFSHLPMTMFDGLPVFDGARMRPDQVEDLVDRLERIAGDRYSDNAATDIADFLEDRGTAGARLQDICDYASCSKPTGLKHLRRLVDTGQLRVVEQKTRGSGSKRKLYIWAEAEDDFGPLSDAWDLPEDLSGLVASTDRRDGMNGDSGIIHHGAAVDGLRCPCSACQYALMEVFDEEERSAARQRGETGFSVGLQARRVRRERAEVEFTKQMQAALVELAALRGGGNDDA